MRKPVTLRMIAAELGVSVQTVSNALQSSGRVAPATAQKVRATAARLGYRPNPGAQALRGAPTRTMALVVSDAAQPATLGRLVPAIFSPIRAAGYRPMLHVAESDDLEEALLPLRQSLVDGVILSASALTLPQIESLARQNAPIVLFERSAPPGTLPYVTVDAAGSVALAVRHLWRNGARRIAYLDGLPQGPMTSSAGRYEGFRRAMTELGLPELPVIQGRWSFDSGLAGFAALRAAGPLPDAVVCGNDQMAAGLLRAAQEAGLSVPGDMMITGFDDLDFAQYTTPQLTSIRAPLDEMAVAAATHLAQMLAADPERPLAAKGMTFSADLILRGSTMPRRDKISAATGAD